ncbi:Uncharacterized protein DBV15_05503 [Temnothorax longispinosus]|uniref:Uncharacterized protein n=1 Tax=Temnothorax longispinosus TaxID=300112 RepID=A0A4V3S9W7_9HYME|nr:Uncharacterized protein DBV15_05503 [Temnothorax longispinosus]
MRGKKKSSPSFSKEKAEARQAPRGNGVTFIWSPEQEGDIFPRGKLSNADGACFLPSSRISALVFEDAIVMPQWPDICIGYSSMARLGQMDSTRNVKHSRHRRIVSILIRLHGPLKSENHSIADMEFAGNNENHFEIIVCLQTESDKKVKNERFRNEIIMSLGILATGDPAGWITSKDNDLG